MYAIDFEFDNKRLSDFGCILTTFDGLRSDTVSSGANITFQTTTSLGSDKFNIYNSIYDEPFSATFDICKNPCDNLNYNNMTFTPHEASTIQRWLCRRDKYCKFKLLEDGYEDIYWNGYFTSQQIMHGSNIIGFSLSFTADSPYAYMEDITLHYTPSANSSFIVDSKSYEEGYIYPNVVITLRAAGNLSLQNNRDERIMTINNCTNGEVITIDGENLLISSSRAVHVLANDFNFYYPRLFNSFDNTQNTFTPSLACNIDITYSPAIKVGF